MQSAEQDHFIVFCRAIQYVKVIQKCVIYPAHACPLHFACFQLLTLVTKLVYLLVLFLCSRTIIWKNLFSSSLSPFILRASPCFSLFLSQLFSHILSRCYCLGKAPAFPFQLACKLPINLRRLGCWLSCKSWLQAQSRNPQLSSCFLSSLPSPSCLPSGRRIGALFSCGEVTLWSFPNTASLPPPAVGRQGQALLQICIFGSLCVALVLIYRQGNQIQLHL